MLKENGADVKEKTENMQAIGKLFAIKKIQKI